MFKSPLFTSIVLVACCVTLGWAQSEQARVAGNKKSEKETQLTEIIPSNRPSSKIPLAGVQASSGQQPVSPVEKLKELRAKLAEQQRQIEQLSAALKEQQQLVENILKAQNASAEVKTSQEPRLGEVASLAAMVPRPPAASALESPAQEQTRAGELQPSPLQFHLGSAFFTPVGFMDMTAVSRSTNAGSGLGTNFAGIPYGNTTTTNLTETRLSIQNSRIGMRLDTNVHGAKVLGYWESDFLGQTGNPPNGTIAVSSNSYPMRLRLFWADVRYRKFEFLAGQSWSMMTPNRKGISALPGDIFYTQDTDTNYQAGLVWGRIPGYRLLYHPSNTVTMGLAFENSEPYVGGANGSGAITPPAVMASELGKQINNGTTVTSAPAVHPDIIGKLAFDPSSRFHFELAGVEITDKVINPATFQTFTKAGAGGSVNLNFEVLNGLRFVTNNYWSDGGGRYIFGQAPDFILRANGDISLVHSASTVTGFEYKAGTTYPTLYYGYYGGVYISRNTAIDTDGKLVGFGYSGAPSNQNRAIQEITFGTNTTFWKDARYGALNLMLQYSYVLRNPWSVATDSSLDAHTHMGFFNLRYTLPGSAPTIQ